MGVLADKLIDYLKPFAKETPIERVIVGARYSAVSLLDGRVGIAMNFRDEQPPDSATIQARMEAEARTGAIPATTTAGADTPSPSPATTIATKAPWFKGEGDPIRLLSMFTSSDPIEASVGVALANALSVGMVEEKELLTGNLFDHLGLRPTDTVGMIGNFYPMVPRLRGSVDRLHIFELIDEPVDDLIPTVRAPELLPSCHVVIITGTTLVNGTIDGILPWCTNAREVAVVGPTTTIVPPVFEGTGITLLGGGLPQNGPAIMEVVANGRGARACLPHFRKVIHRMPRQEQD